MSKFTPDPSKWIDTSSTSKPRKSTQRPLTSFRHGFATPPPSSLSKRTQPPLEHIKQSTLSGYMTPPTTRGKSRFRAGATVRDVDTSASKLKRKKDDGEDFFEIYEDRPELLPGPSRRDHTRSTGSGSSPPDHAGQGGEGGEGAGDGRPFSPMGHPPSTSPYVTDRELPSSVMRVHAKLCGQDEERQRRARSPWATDDEHARKLERLDAEKEAGKISEKEGKKTLSRRQVDARVLKGNKENVSSGKGLKRVKSLVVLSDDEDGVKQTPKRTRLNTGSPMPLSPLRKNVLSNKKAQAVNSRLSRVQTTDRGRSSTRSRSRSRSASPFKPISLEARIMANSRRGSESRDANYPLGLDGHYHAGSQDRDAPTRTVSASPRWKKTISGSVLFATSPKRNITPQPLLRHSPVPAPFPLSLPSDFESIPRAPLPAPSPLSNKAPQATTKPIQHESFPLSPPRPESFQSLPVAAAPTTPTRPTYSQRPETPHKTPYLAISPLQSGTRTTPHHKVSPPKSRTPQLPLRQDISETLFAFPVPAQPVFVRDEDAEGAGEKRDAKRGWKAVEMDPETLMTWSLGPRKDSAGKSEEEHAEMAADEGERPDYAPTGVGIRRKSSLDVNRTRRASQSLGKMGRMRSLSVMSETESIAPSMPSQSFPKLFESTPQKRSNANMGPPEISNERPVTSPRLALQTNSIPRPEASPLQHTSKGEGSSERYVGFGNEASSDISIKSPVPHFDRSNSNLFEDDTLPPSTIASVAIHKPTTTPLGWKHLEQGVLSTPNPPLNTQISTKSRSKTKTKRKRKSAVGASPSEGSSQARLDEYGIIKEKRGKLRGSSGTAFEGEFEDEEDLVFDEGGEKEVGMEAVTSSATELVTPRARLRSGTQNVERVDKGKGKGKDLGKVPDAPHHPKLRAAGVRAMKARETQARELEIDESPNKGEEMGSSGVGTKRSSSLFAPSSDDVSSSLRSDDEETGRDESMDAWFSRRAAEVDKGLMMLDEDYGAG